MGYAAQPAKNVVEYIVGEKKRIAAGKDHIPYPVVFSDIR
jgi:hypothetical protein